MLLHGIETGDLPEISQISDSFSMTSFCIECRLGSYCSAKDLALNCVSCTYVVHLQCNQELIEKHNYKIVSVL